MTDSNAWTWLTDPKNWSDQIGTLGIASQIGNHIIYSLMVLAIAGLIALPAGMAIGHSGRGRWLISLANGLRSLPTTGLLVLCYVVIAPHIQGRGDIPYLIPTMIVLVLLAIPPILAGTYSGVDGVEPSVRDAARGMGMQPRQVLFRVEVPNALPLIVSGIRSATLQVIATATVAAYVGLGGLGRFLYDGLSQHDFAQMTGGAIVVALLALAADFVLALVQRIVVSPGVSGRFRTESSGPRQVDGEDPDTTDSTSRPAAQARA